MRRFLLLIIFACSIYTSNSQNLSFTCPRDTILGCNANCLTIKGQFPDVRALGTDYTFQNVSGASACKPVVDPGGPGPSANLTIDDKYSSEIFLPFGFPFYGTIYNSLIISTNGYVSFDVSGAGNFSHYGILNGGGFLSATTGNPGENLPSTLYDRALIMGPYHDLDPNVTQPTQQIKTNVYGAAPNRQWVLSFYKVPLFLTTCNSLIENTAQIILYESTGVIEVFIRDQQICTGWNDGKAMVGLQDFTQTKGIMAPGRQASDPAWGTIGMNETWRFIPTGGAPLYRSVQLLDATGAVVATGDTTRVNVNTFETSFPNVCPPAGTSLYVIKTTYQKLDDPTPGATIYSLDTIRIIKQAAMPVNTVITPTACSLTTGAIEVTAGAGAAPFTFTLSGPGGPFAPVVSATNVHTFTNLGAGTYTINVVEAGLCAGTATAVVTNIPNLTGTYTATAASCPGINNGSLVITPTLGAAAGPYTYILSGPGGPYTQNAVVSVATFPGLAGGTYDVTWSNAAGCSGTITGMIVSPGITPTASITKVNESCNGANDGTVTVTFGVGAGAGPFNVTLNPGAIVHNGVTGSTIFTGLSPNTYSATFTNAAGCTGTTFTVTVFVGTTPTAAMSHLNTSCPGVNNGTVTVTPNGGAAQGPYNITLNPGGIVQNGIATAATFPGLAPGTYTATFTNAAGCTGSSSSSTTVGTGTGPTGSFSSGNTTCPGVSDGTVTITPNGGIAEGPYNITLNPGAILQNAVASGATFNGLAANTYTATFTNAAGCTGTVGPVTVASGPAVTGTAAATNTSCPTRNDGTITVTPGGTGPYIYTLNPGNVVQNNNPLFTGLAPNTYTITFVTGSGCGGTVAINPVVVAGPFLTSSFTKVDPPCANINDGTITIIPGGFAPYTYVLTGPGGPFTQSTATFTNLAAGTYNYSFTDGNGCTGTGGPIILTTNPPLATTVTLTQPLCNGNANGIIALNASGGVATYQYALSPFLTYQSSGTFNGLIAGSYTFRIKDNVGCTKDTTVTLAEPTLLMASASSTAPASCFGNDGTIVVVGSGGIPAYQYSIDNGATYQTGTTFTAPAVGPYPNIKVKDANGCVATTSTTVILVDAMFLSLGNDTTICAGSSVRFQPQTNVGTSIFNWRPLNPIATLPATIDNPLIKNATATPADTATYILNAQWGACVREDTIIVNILHKPVAHAGLDTAICDRTYAILRGSATNLSGAVNYSWAPADSVLVPTAPITIASPDTTQLYILTVTDNYGCNFSVTDDVLITVQPPVPAYAGHDTIAVLGVPHQLFGSGGVSYLWSPSFPLNLSTAQNPMATLANDQQFVLQVTDVAGCIGYDTVYIQAYQGPNYYVPNAFSPNGDGLNDVFRAVPVGITKTDWFRVFNRYGQLMFETNQWLKGWDGKYKGKPQPMGAYVWIVKGIDKNGRVVEMKGTVMLVQ